MFRLFFTLIAFLFPLISVAEDSNSSLSIKYGVVQSQIQNTDSGNLSVLNQKYELGYSYRLDDSVFATLNLNFSSYRQNSYTAGIRVMANDQMAFHLFGGGKEEVFNYYTFPDQTGPIVNDQIFMPITGADFSFNLPLNDRFSIGILTALILYLPTGNDTYLFSLNAGTESSIFVKYQTNAHLSYQLNILYGNEQHNSSFFTQKQTDIGGGIGLNWDFNF